jgi:hypothetical protein
LWGAPKVIAELKLALRVRESPDGESCAAITGLLDAGFLISDLETPER